MERNSNITFKPATTQRASDVIYQQIYQKIASGVLKPGDRLPAERELCDQFGRSRPSVREALRMLQQDGIIKITVGVNGGAIVQGISMDCAEEPLRKLIEFGTISLHELIEYRSYNDSCCFALALHNHTEEDANQLRDIIHRYRNAIEDFDTFAEIDIEFHKTMAKASHNKLCILMTDVVTALCTNLFWHIVTKEMTREELLEINKKAFENHAEIAEAVITKDTQKIGPSSDMGNRLFSESLKYLGNVDLSDFPILATLYKDL